MANITNDNIQTEYDKWVNDKTPDRMVSMLDSFEPVLSSAIKTYVGLPSTLATSHARLLAAQAVKKYDPKAGTKLRTHLLNQLQPLRRFAAKRRSVVHIPESVQYELSGLPAAEQSLNDELGREPTESEIADRMQMNQKRLAKLRRYAINVQPESARVGEDGAPTLEAVGKNGFMDDWLDMVYHEVGPMDKKILEWRLGYAGKKKKTNAQVAKALGVSPGYVSQRIDTIHERMKVGLDIAKSRGIA